MRIEVHGISHGDRVLLTGSSWRTGAFSTDVEYVVDDETFHRPVIYADLGGQLMHWFIFDEVAPGSDWSVTKVEP